MTHARNIAIVLALAAIVYAIPSAGRGLNLLSWLLGVVFLGTLAWFAAVMYRQHRGELEGLGDRMRLVMYASLALIALTLTASRRLWETGPGTVAWVGLLALAIYGLVMSWRAFRSY